MGVRAGGVLYSQGYTDGIEYRTNGSSGSLTLEDVHYYPFGMLAEGLGTTSPTNDYAYNGKELNEEFGLNWSDYGARWYDASVGRWWSVDLMAEKTVGFSVYTYALNNPALLTDPNGMLAGNPFEVMEERKQKAKERADERNRQIEEIKRPGDLIVMMAGANTFKTSSLGSLPDLANMISDFDNANVTMTPSEFWGVDLQTKEGFDMATQTAYDEIINNYVAGSHLVIYGYSWGGALVNHLADRLKNNGIVVDLLLTVDAAGGSQNNFVRRTVSDNVRTNINFYQLTPEDNVAGFIYTGSHGEPNVAVPGSSTHV